VTWRFANYLCVGSLAKPRLPGKLLLKHMVVDVTTMFHCKAKFVYRTPSVRGQSRQDGY